MRHKFSAMSSMNAFNKKYVKTNELEKNGEKLIGLSHDNSNRNLSHNTHKREYRFIAHCKISSDFPLISILR